MVHELESWVFPMETRFEENKIMVYISSGILQWKYGSIADACPLVIKEILYRAAERTKTRDDFCGKSFFTSSKV